MSYTIQNDWARKDALTPAAAGKVISGTHFYNEFVAVQNEFNNKANKAGDSGQAFESLTQTKSANDNKVATTEYVQTELVGHDTKLIIMQAIYPVGSIFTTVSDSSALATTSAEVATLMGFGAWAAFGEGRVLIGAGSGTDHQPTPETKIFAAGDANGEYNHKLITDEIPAHDHSNGEWDELVRTTGSNTRQGVDSSAGEFDIDQSAQIQSVGGGLVHNNLQPYITVYMWKRTA